jgi:hypothetical protein
VSNLENEFAQIRAANKEKGRLGRVAHAAAKKAASTAIEGSGDESCTGSGRSDSSEEEDEPEDNTDERPRTDERSGIMLQINLRLVSS